MENNTIQLAGKKILLIGCFATTIMSFFAGCEKSAIKCDDADAKALVMEITQGEIKNQLTKSLNPYLSSYEHLKTAQSNDKEAMENKQQMIQRVDKQYKDISPKLVNIRTNQLDDEMEKSMCEADIESLNGEKIAITYTLSKTSEDKLYAEVFGLR